MRANFANGRGSWLKQTDAVGFSQNPLSDSFGTDEAQLSNLTDNDLRIIVCFHIRKGFQ